MFSRRVPLVLASACLLVLASAATAAPNSFTATLTPSDVKPSTSATYTLTLKSADTSDQADKAKIAIPTGFSNPTDVTATTETACNGDPATWEKDGTLIANGMINLKKGSGNTSLCPGGVLTVKFTSVSPAAEDSYAWTPQLLTGDVAFPTFTGDVSVTVDGTPPETTITSNPPALTKETSASFTFESTETGTTFQCSLDSPTTFGACPAGGYTGLSHGQHTFRVRASDAAGNTGPAASYTWTVDTIAPSTTITGNPPASTNLTTASFSFTSEIGATFECSLDALNGGAFAPCTSPTSYPGLPGGTRTFQVRATDQAGNSDPTPASWTWTINLIGPPTQILSGPPSATNSSSASFSFAAGAQTDFECSLDGALFSQCFPPKAYNGLGDGAHTFAVRTVGPNSTGPEAVHTWTIDTRAPRLSVASGPPGLSNGRSASFAFSTDEPSSVQCRLDAGPLVPCTSPVSYQGLADGGHTFVAVPTDGVGNTGAAASYPWTVDATAPQTTLQSRPASQTALAAATFRFAATEPAAFECKLDRGGFLPCRSPKRYSRLRRARHTFSVRAVDAAGNRDTSPATYRWRVGLRKALSALIEPATGAQVVSPPLLRWRPVPRASYYNVQVYRGRVKVLSVWPTRTRLQLRAQWRFNGREHRLTPGKYTWYVWPRFGREASGRYGKELGQSTFTVKRR